MVVKQGMPFFVSFCFCFLSPDRLCDLGAETRRRPYVPDTPSRKYRYDAPRSTANPREQDSPVKNGQSSVSRDSCLTMCTRSRNSVCERGTNF